MESTTDFTKQIAEKGKAFSQPGLFAFPATIVCRPTILHVKHQDGQELGSLRHAPTRARGRSDGSGRGSSSKAVAAEDPDWLQDLSVSINCVPIPHRETALLTPIRFRLRRIKCDEARPICNKCASSGRTCAGYEMGAPAAAGDRSFLLPRSVLFLDSSNYVAPSLPMLPVRLTPSEIRAFDCFRTKIVHLLSIHFSAPVWKDVILRHCHEDPTTLHGLVAIGAMFQVRYGAADQQQALAPSMSSGHSDEDLALRHYTKALAGLRTSIANATTSDRTAITQATMIACLLFVTFEMLKGDQMQALSHMMKGLAILGEHSRPSAAPRSSKPVKRPIPSATLDKIGRMFARLNAECAMSGPWTSSLQSLDEDLDIDDTLNIPTSFHSISDAKACLDMLNTIVLQLRNTLLRMAEEEHPQPAVGAPQCLRDFCTLNTRARRLHPDVLIQLVPKRDRLLSSYDRWVDALTPLQEGLSLPTAVLMEVQSFFWKFTLSTLLDGTELPCDDLSDRFEHVLDLTNQYAKGSNRKAGSYGFALDSGILVSLYLLGLKCRDSILRRKAIALLKQAKVQEGLWSGGVLAAVVERMIAIEEERARALGKALSQDHDLRSDQVPEEARFSDVMFVLDSHLIRIVCSRFAEDTPGELEVIEEIIPAP